jgi:hypothetical protein
VFATPGQFAEFVIRASAENNTIAVSEVFIEACEFGDLGSANEGEIFRVEEIDLPFPLKAFLRDRLKSGFAVFFVFHEFRFDTGDGKFGKCVANTKH